jgi:hypothetical protein
MSDVATDREEKLKWFRDTLLDDGIDVRRIEIPDDDEKSVLMVLYEEPKAEWLSEPYSFGVIAGRYTSLMQWHLRHADPWEPPSLEALVYDPAEELAAYWEMDAEWARAVVRADLEPRMAQNRVAETFTAPQEMPAERLEHIINPE